MHTLRWPARDTLVPIAIKVVELERLLLAPRHRATFASAWNWLGLGLGLGLGFGLGRGLGIGSRDARRGAGRLDETQVARAGVLVRGRARDEGGSGRVRDARARPVEEVEARVHWVS